MKELTQAPIDSLAQQGGLLTSLCTEMPLVWLSGELSSRYSSETGHNAI
jgi:hypothetical protein